MSDIQEGEARNNPDPAQTGEVGNNTAAIMRAAGDQPGAVVAKAPSPAEVMAMLEKVSGQLAAMRQQNPNDPTGAMAATDAALAAAAVAMKPKPPEDFDAVQAAFDHDQILSRLVGEFGQVKEVVQQYFREHFPALNGARDRTGGPGS